VVAGVLVSVSACTSSEGSTTDFGQRAIDLARRVPGCSNVKQAAEMASGAGTSATCVIDGHQIHIYAFADSAAGNKALVTVFTPSATASGKSWFATVGADTVRVQRQIAGQIAKALGGTVAVNRH
jgi:hypothetical protein